MHSSDRFLEQVETLRKEFIALRDRPFDSNTITDYDAMDRQFAKMLEDPEVGDGEAAAADCEARVSQLELEYGELEMEQAQLQSALAEEQRDLARRMNGDCLDDIDDVSAELSQQQDKRLYQSYCAQLADLSAGLALAKTVFEGLLTASVAEICEERTSAVDVRFADPVNWGPRREQLQKLLNDVQGKAGQLGLTPPLKEEVLFVEVDELGTEAARHLAAGAAQRTKRDEQLATFYEECAKLTVWCRQQLANLDAMVEPDHIQEFCRTLADNYATMSSNFGVLVNSVQPYVRENHVAVKQALLDVDQVWFHVVVAALERLSKTLFEIHPRSRLEDEVEKYAAHPKHLMELLKTIRTFLQQETDLSEGAEALLKECEELCNGDIKKREAASVRSLKEFAKRVRVERAAYQCFRESILSRLTYAAPPADVVLESKRRQMEFEQCTKELKTWAAAQAHGESWRDIYSKIVEIKRVIQQEQEYVDERAGVPMN